jgi:hypothetical protein
MHSQYGKKKGKKEKQKIAKKQKERKKRSMCINVSHVSTCRYFLNFRALYLDVYISL